MFFFNKKIACSLSVLAFMANASNSIMKSAVFCFPCLKDSIFHLASAAFVLLLNVILISLTKSSQSWMPSSLSSSLSFFYAYISTTSPLRWARIAVILLSVSMTLLLLRNNHIPFYQSSNFIQLLLNYPGSSTMFFGVTAYMFLLIAAGAGATDISVFDCS